MGESPLSFINQCRQYYRYSTDAPANFGEMLGVQLLGHAMGYDAIHLIQPKAVHHNMYVCLVGESTLTRKSTTQGLGKDIYPYERCLPDETSPEQLVVSLSERPEGFSFLGEFTGLLKGITGGGYMARFVEVLNDLHGCPKRYTRKLRKRKGEDTEFTIVKGYLDANSTITPPMIKHYLTEELAAGGFMARWLLTRGEPKTRPRERLHPNVLKLNETLKNVLEAITLMDRKVEFEYSDEALKRYNEIEQEAYRYENALPYAGRYLNYLVAISDILLVSDAIGVALEKGSNIYNFKQLKELIQLIQLNTINTINERDKGNKAVNCIKCIIVSSEYVDRAWEIVKPCLIFANELVEYVVYEKTAAKLMECVRKHGRIGHSPAMVKAHLDAEQMKKAIPTLVQMGLIKVENEDVERKGAGKITKNIYVWIGENVK